MLAWRGGNIARSAKSIYIAAGLGNKKISHIIRDGFPPRVRAPSRLCSEEHKLMCWRGGFKLSRVLKSMVISSLPPLLHRKVHNAIPL
jgi:hypothetical protein